MIKRFSIIFFFIIFSIIIKAEEGMFLLDKISPELYAEMKAKGLKLSWEQIYNEQGTGLSNAVINLGGGTASFISANGLIITNHHVAFSAIQRVSTAENNYIESGFLAKNLEEEIPAPGYQAYVFLSMKDVSKEVKSVIKDNMSDLQVYRAIEKKIKEIIKREEKPGEIECVIESMNNGMQYYLFKYLKLRDIRIVYVPADAIGNYGGEIDNWMWPRHAGDFSFLRAYVSPSGKPADYSKDNVPYHPKTYLKISKEGIKEGDFTMIIGYPGRTMRRLTSYDIELDQNFRYPYQIKIAQDLIDIFEKHSKENEEAKVRLSSLIKSFSNVLKNNQGMLEGIIKSKLLDKKKDEEAAFLNFIKTNIEMEKKYGNILPQLKKIIEERDKIKERSILTRLVSYACQMLNWAITINKLSLEKEKKDMERELGYQERDIPNILLRLKVSQMNYVPEADKEIFSYFIKENLKLPKERRFKVINDLIEGKENQSIEEIINKFVDNLYKNSNLAVVEERIRFAGMKRKDLIKINDPFIEFASKLEAELEYIRTKEKELSGATTRLMPIYLEGISIWTGKTLYPDANRTIRFNYGEVKGYSAKDAIIYKYITSLTGLIEKNTGKEPFIAPQRILEIYAKKDFADYIDPKINDVPVNFLTTNDSTGGNSGSPVLNGKGELIGLLFDGNYESIYSDYYFNPEITRSINVDIRYVLFIADKLNNAANLLKEINQ